MAPVDDDALHVLITGFGPFRGLKENPSWLAVKRLHNTTIHTADPASAPPAAHRKIHLTALEVPVVYDTVLALVPGLHARPPVLPAGTSATPPAHGYDLVVHVGLGIEQPLRLERRGHKTGYNAADVEGRLAPVVGGSGRRAVRGFGAGYEAYGAEILTGVDLPALLGALHGAGLEGAFVSEDAGHYLCDFIYYCSLAEAARAGARDGEAARGVLFVHCSPVGAPLSTEDVVAGLETVVAAHCARL